MTPTRRQADGSFRLPAPPAWMVEAGAGVWRWPKFGFVVCFSLPWPRRAVLRYAARSGLYTPAVGLEPTPANLGGVRWWWLCPGCGRRCGKLYLPPRSDVLACRVCHDLSYESAQASRAFYYEMFKADARGMRTVRRGRVCRMPTSRVREAIREGLGGFTVAPYEGVPEPLNRNTARHRAGKSNVEIT